MHALAYVVLGLWLLGGIVGAVEGVHPFRDRPPGYLVVSVALEIAVVALAVLVLV